MKKNRKSDNQIHSAYNAARERYARLGVETEKALAALAGISLSLHCWQGDDVGGFEHAGAVLESGSGLQVTGNYPGKARTPEELRADLTQAYSLIPGRHRLNLHAMYGDFTRKPADRNEIGPEHFRTWMDWARAEGVKLDFNATCFSHPLAASGFTLSSKEKRVRTFWVEHVKQCRLTSAAIGREQKSPCIHDLWIPDGSKDVTMDRWKHRALLLESLDDIYSVSYDARHMKDALESKLFGIGSEAFVTGSHEFYLAYALRHNKMPCIDTGHFHPTESVADKISSLLLFFDEILLHVSRGVRWDSDHVTILNDEVRALAEEIVRANRLSNVHIALDYFDASMNRVGAWVIGARAVLKSFLLALLEPHRRLREYENTGDFFGRLALLEELKTMPHGAVWDYHCLRAGVPPADAWMKQVRSYGARTQRDRKAAR
jgi:L-rhamnose isomerase